VEGNNAPPVNIKFKSSVNYNLERIQEDIMLLFAAVSQLYDRMLVGTQYLRN